MIYSKEFFKIQLQFAHVISKKKNIPYTQALFLYTCIYVRLFGYIDDTPPDERGLSWVGLVENLPRNQKDQLQYIYQKYLERESQPKSPSTIKMFGCFGYSYHEKINQYELHFAALDPKGNLGSDRIIERMKNWKDLFQDMYSYGRENTTCKIDTWLIGIDAFSRLLPHQFVAAIKPYRVGSTQTFTFWGPLVNRFRNYKYIEDYFPRKALTSEVKTEVFYNFDLGHK